MSTKRRPVVKFSLVGPQGPCSCFPLRLPCHPSPEYSHRMFCASVPACRRPRAAGAHVTATRTRLLHSQLPAFLLQFSVLLKALASIPAGLSLPFPGCLKFPRPHSYYHLHPRPLLSAHDRMGSLSKRLPMLSFPPCLYLSILGPMASSSCCIPR